MSLMCWLLSPGNRLVKKLRVGVTNRTTPCFGLNMVWGCLSKSFCMFEVIQKNVCNHHHHKLVVQKTILGDGLSSKNKFVDSHFPNNSFISIGIQKSNQGKISGLSKATPFQFQSGQASRKKSREDVKHIFGETTLSKLPHGNKEARKNIPFEKI